jgi:UDP-N-acetylglucosamine 1-carboxyvinyltransferase
MDAFFVSRSMADLIINGGRPLSGTIVPSGNKNSALPVFCATLLASEPVRLLNVPDITDLEKLVEFFVAQGSRITWDRAKGEMRIDHAGFDTNQLKTEMPVGMRSTVLLFAPLLWRMKKIVIPAIAKGCSLGVRELDPHLDLLQALGAEGARDGSLTLTLAGRFRATRCWQDYMSVTATENFVMAAVLADGESTLINAASEPHVQDLCTMLNGMGARIEGVGTSMLRVTGVKELHGGTFTINSDYHEIVTFLALGAITGGEVRVERSLPAHFDLIARAFAKLGVAISHDGTTAVVKAGQQLAVGSTHTSNLLPKIEAAPWPYFPVDLLPCMIALSVRARGEIQFWNKVYEGGFTWLPELAKFGAHLVVCDPHRVIVFGDRPLRPAAVEAPYIIRAAVALYMVAASIPGRSVVRNAEIIKRAHPRFVENLRALGADVAWTG